MNKIELLSPAGSWGALEAAVQHGADAVYLGGKNFGARMLADNFDNTKIQEAIRYAHLRDVKVYVTVNTIATNQDLPRMIRYVQDLYNWGADAVIVQDIGTALLVREHAPKMPVHASTQMTTHNRGQVEWAEKNGFSAVVLSREVPLHSIDEMFSGLSVKPEVFVHGALCYSFAGQCTFSHIRQDRSGNRGACAQPCRRSYKMVRENKGGTQETIESKGSYPLSMKDLCTVQNMDKIVESSVSLIKIEGRMKKPSYVGITTRIYRKYLDQALAGEFKGVEQKDLDLLWLAYNRDFTQGYLFDQRFAEVKGRLRADNKGLFLGAITSVDRARKTMMVQPETSIVPNTGDVLKIVSDHDYRNKNLNVEIKNVEVNKRGALTINSLPEANKGDHVYLATHNIMPYVEEIDRRIPVELVVKIRKGRPIDLIAKARGIEMKVTGETIVSEAKTQPLEKETVETQMRKTDKFNFELAEITIDLEDGCFAPIGELNSARRKLLEQMESKWLRKHHPLPKKGGLEKVDDDIWPSTGKKRPARGVMLSAITEDPKGIPALREAGVDRIYLDALYGLQQKNGVKRVVEGLKGMLGSDVYLKTPRITFDGVLPLLEEAITELKDEAGGFVVGNMGSLEVVRKAAPDAKIVAASSFNITNSVSAQYMLEDCERVGLSIELSEEEMVWTASRMKNPDRADVVAGGKHTLLITHDCPLGSSIDDAKTGPGGFYDRRCNTICSSGFWYMKDDKKRLTPIWMDRDCRGHLYNNRVLDVNVKRLTKAGLGSFVIDLRGFPAKKRKEALDEFKAKLDEK